MPLALVPLLATFALEVLLYATILRPLRTRLAPLLAAAVILCSCVWLIERPQLSSLILFVLSLYRGINLFRLYKNRLQPDYLYYSARRASFWLVAAQAVVIAMLASHRYVSLLAELYGLTILQGVVASTILGTTLRNIRSSRPVKLSTTLRDKDLPTLTVAIPARNETSDLENCLKSLIATTYPKLEIIVLDDCSQDKRTPAIIRDFAHEGVRFIPGDLPPAHWLAKNYAYKQLAAAANGEFILFCGVDVQFAPDSLCALVAATLSQNKSMVSLLPRNIMPSRLSLSALLIQPGRYAWELSLPRAILRRPPVLSTCWLIKAETLRAVGGFNAVSRKVVPESYFARQTASTNGYSFFWDDNTIGITSQKSLVEQEDTAVRTRYPQLHKRPELVAAVSLAEYMVFLWSLSTLVIALLQGLWPLAGLAAVGFLLVTLIYNRVIWLTYRQLAPNGLWALPLAILYDLALLNYSMLRYEFGEVLWKGRNVCVPVMRTLPRLPKLS